MYPSNINQVTDIQVDLIESYQTLLDMCSSL